MADTLVAVTDDGVLVGWNGHGSHDESHRLVWAPAAGDSHALLVSQPWWSTGGDAGANEHGVVATANPVLTRRAGKRPEGALAGPDLLRRALERAVDRREAVEVVVGLLEEHGQDTGADAPGNARDTSFVLADRSGVTLLETAGRHSATEEITGPRAVSGALTIPDFARRHGDPVRGRLWRTGDRRARAEAAAGRAQGPRDLMTALRAHGGARPPDLPKFRPATGSLRGPCVHAGGLAVNPQTTASWISDLRRTRPPQAGASGEAATHWVTGTAAPCTSVFWPAAVGVPAAAASGVSTQPGQTDDPDTLWWRHERVHRAALRDAARTLDPLATGRDVLEQLWVGEPPTTAEALSAAEAWRASGLEGLRALEPADTRPVRVTLQWRRWSNRAGVPDWGGLAREAS